MWPPRHHDTIIQTICTERQLHCFWFTQKKQDHKITLQAHSNYPLASSSPNALYNLTEVQRALHNFITKNHLEYSQASITLCPPFITQALCTTAESNAQVSQLIKKPKPHLHYQHRYLGPYDQTFLFYVSSIAQTLLLQLQAITTQLPIHVVSITTPLQAQCVLLKKLLGPAYNQAQLAQEINRTTARIERVFSRELIHRFLHVKQPTKTVYEPLLYALGSHLGMR